jgi:hypothetical protein
MSLLREKTPLPREFMGILILYLVVVVVMTLYEPAVNSWSWASGRLSLRKAARINTPEVIEVVRSVRGLLQHGYSDTVIYVLQQVAQWAEIRGQVALADADHLETLRSWASSIQGRLEPSRGEAFTSLCREVGSLIQRYDQFCCANLRTLQSLLAGVKVPEERLRRLKQDWNTQREHHLDVVKQWTSIARRVNKTLGQPVCLDSYEVLGTLE